VRLIDKETHRKTDGQTDKQTDRQAGRQTQNKSGENKYIDNNYLLTESEVFTGKY
jgi:hypothetical protein